MSLSPPLAQICVIIAAYNAEKTIARAVASALAQSQAAEVIVVDDASTDATIAKAQAADDGTGRLKLLVQDHNKGPAAARNRAIAESNSPWLAVLDADDFFLPGRLEKLLHYAADADFIADNMGKVPETNIQASPTPLLQNPPTSPQTISFNQFVLSNIAKAGKPRTELGFIKPLMRRAFFTKHGLHYQEHMRLGEDFELYARALGHGARMLLVPVLGYIAVVRPDSLSGRHSEADLLHLRNCDQALLQDLSLNKTNRHALRAHYRSLDCRLQWRLLILAVKNHNIKAALATFLHPWPVPLYLMRQLLQTYLQRKRGIHA